MIKFSVTQNGSRLATSKYNWDEKTKTFSSNENELVLDFNGIDGVTFKTVYSCTFNTGDNCTFKTGWNCTFKTVAYCTFKTGENCTFNTGYYCTFNTGDNCTFNTGENCFATRYNVKGVIEIPEKKTIKLNGYGISGYTEIKEEIKEEIKKTNCEGKVVEIEGKKYKLVSV